MVTAVDEHGFYYSVKKGFRVALFLCVASLNASAANITGMFFGNGQYKLAQEDLWPNSGSSTNTLNANWNGKDARLTMMKNEHRGGMFYLQNNTGSQATNVTFTVAPFIGPSGTVISSTATICSGTTDYTQREFEVFWSTYVKIEGFSTLAYPLEYEEGDLPVRFRNSCTTNVNNDCQADAPNLWTTRPDANKFLPEGLVPMECKTSFTVGAGKSQGIWLDIYTRKSLLAGVYTSTVSVLESGVVSTSTLVNLTVVEKTLPDTPSMKVMAEVSADDIDFRQNGIAHNFGCATATCVNTRENYYRFLHRHGLIPMGDTPNINTNFFPSTEYQNQMAGTTFSAANKYMGRGLDTGSKAYSIGTYGHWNDNPNWSSTNASLFCVAISSWAAYFQNNYPSVRSWVYLQDEPTDLTLVNKWSTWMATVTACQTSYKVASWVTVVWPIAVTSAPYVNNPVTPNWIARNYTQTDWINAANRYNTVGSTQGWGYNGGLSWAGSMYATEDDGIGPMIGIIASFKLGVNGWFLWQTTNWYNPGNQSPAENLLLSTTSAKTFGYYGANNTNWGKTGFTYGNGDGVLLYPGTDTYAPSASFGIDGPIASLRLKYVRNAVNFHDYATLAYAVDPASTTAIINSLLPTILYQKDCYTYTDCTYSYAGRLWSSDPNVWETQLNNLATIAASGGPQRVKNHTFFGRFQLIGRRKIQ